MLVGNLSLVRKSVIVVVCIGVVVLVKSTPDVIIDEKERVNSKNGVVCAFAQIVDVLLLT